MESLRHPAPTRGRYQKATAAPGPSLWVAPTRQVLESIAQRQQCAQMLAAARRPGDSDSKVAEGMARSPLTGWPYL
jgi:hypothetical protein